MDDDTLKQLMELKYVTQKTGALHPLQMKNLQMWGYLSFPHLKSGKVQTYFHYDKRTITYVISAPLPTKTKTQKKNAQLAQDRLNVWVQELLGAEYSAVVEADGEVVYRGKREAAIPKAAKPPKFKEPSDG
jgi:hypothetical protein